MYMGKRRWRMNVEPPRTRKIAWPLFLWPDDVYAIAVCERMGSTEYSLQSILPMVADTIPERDGVRWRRVCLERERGIAPEIKAALRPRLNKGEPSGIIVALTPGARCKFAGVTPVSGTAFAKSVNPDWAYGIIRRGDETMTICAYRRVDNTLLPAASQRRRFHPATATVEESPTP